jgi:hypothetical protein
MTSTNERKTEEGMHQEIMIIKLKVKAKNKITVIGPLASQDEN